MLQAYFRYLLLLACVSALPVYAQRPAKPHSKGHYVDSLNRYYQQAELPLYIYVSHSPDVKPTQLGRVEKEKPEMKPIYLDGHGIHNLRHLDALHSITDNFYVYADGMAPKSTARFLNAPSFVKNARQYYGKGLTVTLSTQDEMSGVLALYYGTDQEDYKSYNGSIAIDKEGERALSVYAVDRVGNVETPQGFSYIVDLSAPETFHNIVGIASGNIISVSTKLYLTHKDNLSGVGKTFYRFDLEGFKPYTSGNIDFTYLPDGEHTIYYYSVDNVANKEVEKSFTFYLDKTAPIMSADVLGDKFVVNDKVYFSGRTKLKLTAVDNKSGIKSVQYSIDGSEFQNYSEPFYLPSKSGMHIIRYFALDNMENEGTGGKDARFDEYRHNVSAVYVDLTGPALSFQYIGNKFQKGDTVYIGGQTQVRLDATDPESGLQYIAYSIDGQETETKYGKPFTVGKSGFHKVDFFGYDNVNNRNVSGFILVVDETAPELFHHFSILPSRTLEGDIPVYPSYSTLSFSATDSQTGAENIRYSINGGQMQTYTGPLKGFEKGKRYTITAETTDKLGNKQTKDVIFQTADY